MYTQSKLPSFAVLPIMILMFLVAPTVQGQDLSRLLNAHIVYYTDPNILDIDRTSRIQQTVPSVAATNWDEVQAINSERPIDVLVIDNSMLGTVDATWLSSSYWNGMVVVGIDIAAQDLATITNNPCLARNHIAPSPSTSFFIVASDLFIGTNNDDVALVSNSYRNSCTEPIGAERATGMVVGSHYYTASELIDDLSFSLLSLALNAHLISNDQVRQGLVTSSQAPTIQKRLNSPLYWPGSTDGVSGNTYQSDSTGIRTYRAYSATPFVRAYMRVTVRAWAQGWTKSSHSLDCYSPTSPNCYYVGEANVISYQAAYYSSEHAHYTYPGGATNYFYSGFEQNSANSSCYYSWSTSCFGGPTG